MNKISNDDLINFEYAINLIEEQLGEVMSTNLDYYNQYHFEISNEQFFVDDDDREPNNIYIVIQFLPADIDYGQTVLPFTIRAVSEENGVAAAQKLLLEYAQIYNLTEKKDEINNKVVFQSYTTPNVSSNFETIYDGFRSILTMSGTILLSSNINRIKLRYYEGDYAILDIESLPTNLSEKIIKDNKEIDLFSVKNTNNIYAWDEENKIYKETNGIDLDILTFTDQYGASPDTQPYFENQNFTSSIVKYGTYSFIIATFLVNDDFTNKVLKILSRKKGPNTNFYFIIEQDNGLNMPLLEYKIINVGRTQDRGQMPAISMTFTN